MEELPQLPVGAFGPRSEALRAAHEANAEAARHGEPSVVGGQLIDGGAARVKPLDREALARFQERSGRMPRSLEADWVATTFGLYYVSPEAFYVWSRPWTTITVRARRPRWKFARLDVTTTQTGETLTFGLSRAAALNLLAIAHHYGAAD